MNILKKIFIKTVASTVILAMIVNTEVFAQASDEYTSRVKEVVSNTYDIADGIDYTQSVLSFGSDYQRTYKFVYTPGKSGNILFSGGSSLYSRKLIDTLIDYEGTTKGNVVGAVNADFFNMSTGVPESAFIRDGVLYTSDRDNFCFAFKNDGTAFFDKPKTSLSMNRNGTEYNIVFLNKELTDYGIYMYTDVFSDTTRIGVPSTELVLYPYTESKTYEMLALEMFGDNLPDDLYIKDYINDETESQATGNDFDEPSDENLETESNETEHTEIEQTDKTEVAADEQTVADNGTADEETAIIESESFNYDVYSKLIEEYAAGKGFEKYGDNFYILGKAEPRIGKSQQAVVTENRQDGNGTSNVIPKGAYVLAADNNKFGYTLAPIAIGETVTISVNGNETFYDVENAIGCGCMLVNNGVAVENTALSHYKYANPRTAIGLKADGSIVLFAVDGRQSGFSVGMKLSELSQEMLKAGCIYAANLDGGGSTTVKANLPYNTSFTTVNRTSDTSERKIANAILLTNMLPATGIPAHTYFAGSMQFVLSEAGVPLGRTYYTDTNHYQVDEKDVDKSKFTYSVQDGHGIIKDGYYYPDGYVGNVKIISKQSDGYENEAASLVSTDYVDSVYIVSLSKVDTVYVGETIDLTAGAKRYSFNVSCNDENFTWHVDPQYGYVLEDGLFVAQGAGKDITVTASYGDKLGTFKVNVLEYPFSDISGHWSSENICRLYDQGVVEGENTQYGRMFFPDRAYTRNEFCAMLSRILGYTSVQENSAEIESETADELLESPAVSNEPETHATGIYADENEIPAWANDSVLALYNKGLLDNFSHTLDGNVLFDGNKSVTRREVMSVIGILTANSPEDYTLNASDVSKDSDDYTFIRSAVAAGIFEGYEDGTLRPENNLSRAEGAAVFVRLAELLGSK